MTRPAPPSPASAATDAMTWSLPFGLTLIMLFLGGLSLFAGASSLEIADVLRGLTGGDETYKAIIWQLRMPRMILAVLAGASLGLAGAVLQGLLRNPLAEPGLIGISAAAGLGAVTVLYTGLAGTFTMALPLGGITGAAAAVGLLLALAGRHAGVFTLILAGVAVNSMAGSLTALVLNLSENPYATVEIVFWMLGSLADRGFDHVAIAALLMIPGWALLLGTGRGLDALTLGEEAAASMGVNLTALRLRAVAGTALAVGAAVAISGVIGFVGLVVPHLLRPLVGHQPGRLLTVSALGGAILLLAADITVRILPTVTELKIGVITAFLGAPFFLALLAKMRRAVQ